LFAKPHTIIDVYGFFGTTQQTGKLTLYLESWVSRRLIPRKR